jgi:hypothetical protein
VALRENLKQIDAIGFRSAELATEPINQKSNA